MPKKNGKTISLIIVEVIFLVEAFIQTITSIGLALLSVPVEVSNNSTLKSKSK